MIQQRRHSAPTSIVIADNAILLLNAWQLVTNLCNLYFVVFNILSHQEDHLKFGMCCLSAFNVMRIYF